MKRFCDRGGKPGHGLEAGSIIQPKWQREHKIAVVVGIVISAAFGVLIGYVLFALAYGSAAATFGYWIWHPLRNSVVGWGVFGGIIGAAIIYAVHLMRR